MRASVLINAMVAVLVGFGSSLAVVLEAARALAATPAQTASWVAALCLAIMATTAWLSYRHRQPIVTAWSTPGAALIAGTSGLGIEAAVGAFFVATLLVLATAALKPAMALVERLPSAIAAAMLAGVLFGFVVEVFLAIPREPALVLPLIALFLVLRLFSPSWAVLAVLVAGIALSHLLGLMSEIGELAVSRFAWIAPRFEIAAVLGVALPLYLVTMASQNLPGFAVLRASGYPVPSRSILLATGLSSLATAGTGAHTTNLSSITAAICTGPEAHPDPAKRWLCGPVYAAGYALLTLFGASLVTLFASFPAELIAALAGLALIGPMTGAVGASLAREDQRFPALVTFVVTASGLTLLGLGAAFWGLAAGLMAFALERAARATA